MQPEIADSDAESDFDSPVKRRNAPEGNVGHASASQVSLSAYDFDQFLSPTQRLSSFSPHHTGNADDMSGDAANHLNGIYEQLDGAASDNTNPLFGEVLPVVWSTKRRHSSIQGNSTGIEADNAEKKPKAKRSKTYGAAAKARSSTEIDLFAPPPETSSEYQNSEPARPTTTVTNEILSRSDPKSTDEVAPVSTNLGHPPGVISLLGQSLTDSTHRMTTSVASIGRYESINLDFRGSGQGLDINTNPFGSLSQVSLDQDPNPAETERFASLFRPNEDQANLIGADQNPVVINRVPLDQPPPTLSQSSPERPLAIDPSNIMQHDEAMLDPIDEHHSLALEVTTDLSDTTAPSDTVASTTEKPPAKKHGRKAKNSRFPSQSPAPGIAEDVEELPLPNPPPANISRQGTLDSLSQTYQPSATNTSTQKRKRGKSKLVEEPPLAQATESSPMKQFTNELNLSDEGIIGLPKEAYKPRPSRSRSKKIDEESPMPPPPAPDTNHSTPARNIAKEHPDPEEETPSIAPAKSSGKKGRKSKVKRAKTSAAALLKKADPMLSEGEEDVVWMDSKPAPVKLDLPPDLKVLKMEVEVLKEEQNEQQEDSLADVDAAHTNGGRITIEIPTVNEVKDLVTEPKKRGWKPKKGQHKSEEKVVEEANEEDNVDSRPALAEKSINLQSIASRAPKAPTISPISSPEPADKQQPQAPSRDQEDPPPITTPSKPTPALQSPEKGPTKHSPINPPSISSGKKVLYRIGLSRRQNIPSLLRKVQRDKPPPKIVVRKEKESKKKKDTDGGCDGDGEGEGGVGTGEMRGPDGMLIEWGD